MQPAFSPLCVVSARITAVVEEEEEEEMRGRRKARKSGCLTSAAFSLTFPWSHIKNRPMGFAL